MKFLLSPEIATRQEFARLCIHRNLLTSAVEVGVHRARFAKPFLDIWPGKTYFCVDPWESFWEHPGPRDMDYQWAMSRLTDHADRIILIREKSSEDVAQRIMDHRGGIEFVYIDGDHHYDAIKKDLETFWPRMSPIGIMAGHDYTRELPEVVKALREFADRENLTVYLTHDIAYKSWYIYKNQEVPPFVLYESWDVTDEVPE